MLDKLQRKFGRYAIPNLTLYLMATYVIGYLLVLFQAAGVLSAIAFFPPLILRGQVWRLITWLIMPSGVSSPFILFLMLFIFYQFGSILERTWGAFRYNFYIFSGILITIICGFVGSAIGSVIGWQMDMGMNSYYIATSIFLAVAAMYPEMEVRLYFIIPIKFKWAAIIDIAFLAYEFYRALQYHYMSTMVMIAASLINLLLILLKKTSPYQAARQAKRRREFTRGFEEGRRNATYQSASGTITKHKCAICGRTELDGDDLEFRFCSKCNGNYEYCQDHLFTHPHVK